MYIVTCLTAELSNYNLDKTVRRTNLTPKPIKKTDEHKNLISLVGKKYMDY